AGLPLTSRAAARVGSGGALIVALLGATDDAVAAGRDDLTGRAAGRGVRRLALLGAAEDAVAAGGKDAVSSRLRADVAAFDLAARAAAVAAQLVAVVALLVAGDVAVAAAVRGAGAAF